MNNAYRRWMQGLLPVAVAVTSGCVVQAPAGSGSASAPIPGSSQSAPAPTSPSRLPKIPGAGPVPARLAAVSPSVPGASAACLAQVEAFAELHSGNRVMLGPAAFAGTDQLVLTRTPRRGPDGRLIDGRASPPDALVLILSTGPKGCSVRVAAGSARGVGDSPQRSADLPACSCVPMAD